MSAGQGSNCPNCGTWIAADGLACICGGGNLQAGRDAGRALGSGVAVWAIVASFWGMGKLHYGGAALAVVCGLPLFVAALCLMVYGISLGAVALRSPGAHKGVAWAGVVLCASPLLLVLGLIVARQIG